MTICRPGGRREHGFTMVELIVMMVVIAILGSFAVSRFADRATYDADAFYEQSKALIRYGQKVAIAQNRPVFIRLNGTSVALCFDETCTNNNRLRSTSGANSASAATAAACDLSAVWACEGAPTGVSYTVAPANPTMSFDAAGRPFSSANTLIPTGQRLLLNVAEVGGVARQILIEGETGYVH